MCFGAEASFIASGSLATIGIITLRETESKPKPLLATLPLLFALHQALEGALWLQLKHGHNALVQRGLTVSFLVIAFLIWPVFSPLTVYTLEPEAKRRRWMAYCVALGAIVAAYLSYFLAVGPATAEIVSCSIAYDAEVSGPRTLLFLYLIAVFGPYFLSSYRELPLMGALNTVLFGLTFYYYFETLISLWCFFAAVLSGMILIFFRRHRRDLVLLSPDRSQ